ncbi:MAG: ABC transporter ATP-binding protein [Hyphomicrobiales bacterium]|nr:ABC transporter ATP-binding protein [Hyphomicrobiales bacterium]
MSYYFPKKIIKLWHNFQSSEQYTIVARVFADNFSTYRNRYFLAIAMMIIASALTGASAWMMREVINSMLNEKEFVKILYIGLFVIAIFSIKGFATYAQTVILALIGNSLVARLRLRVYNHLLSLKVEYFDRTTMGEIFTRANAGVGATNAVIRILIMTVFRDVLTLFFLGLVMFMQEPLISLVVLVIGPISIVFIRSIIRKTRQHAKKQLRDRAVSTSLLKETISGIIMIKTYSLENEMRGRMENVVEELRKRNDRLAKLSARISPIMETLGGLTLGTLIIYAGWWTTNVGTESLDPDYPGKLMSFITAFLLAYAPAKKLAGVRVSMERMFVSVRHMYELLDNQEPESKRFDGHEPIKTSNGDVSLKNICFSYSPELPVLHDVSLSGKAGEKIGLVGPSGGGKSTIFKLIMALYQPTSGTIQIDNQDIFNATSDSARSAISYVGQETHIFTGSVLENIKFGKTGASKNQIVEAAKLANAHEFITRLNNSYDTFVGENGAQLSGGQRQRIAIARAFLKDAPIVLLDEATSSLDSGSEQAIQAALDSLVTGKTTFIIAHRLSTVQKCDKIYVVANGKIIEQGTHENLINDNNIYAQLFKLQFGN